MTIEQIKNYLYLMRFDKPIGIFLLLWPTLWALWLAGQGKPNILIVIIFVCGVILMRAAGCVINDIADRRVDGHVKRTQERPLVTEKITVKQAAMLFALLMACAFCLVLFLNVLTLKLAFVGALLTSIYPYLKRVTHLPQLGLGLAFAWSVPMAFAAQTSAVPTVAWLLFLAAALWPVIYDTLYAMVDRDDDVKIGVKSTAILLGRYDRAVIGMLQVIFVLLLIKIGNVFNLSYAYFLSLVVVGALFIYQQILIKSQKRDDYFKAFLNNHWVGFFVFIGILLGYYL